MFDICNGLTVLHRGQLLYPADISFMDREAAIEECEKKGRTLTFHGITVPLYSGPTLEDAVNFLCERNASDLAPQAEESFTKWKNEFNIDRKVSESLENLASRGAAIKMILFEIMPSFLQGYGEKRSGELVDNQRNQFDEESYIKFIVSCIGGETLVAYKKREEELSEQTIGKIKARKETAQPAVWEMFLNQLSSERLKNRTRVDSLVSRLYATRQKMIAQELFIFINNALFQLAHEPASQNPVYVTINDEQYFPQGKFSFSMPEFLKSQAGSRMCQERVQKFIEDFGYVQEKFLREAIEKKALVDYLSQTDSFEVNNVGFKRLEKGYEVYVGVPQHALINGLNEIFLFPAAHVATKLSIGKGNSISFSAPYVIEKHRHPFLYGENKGEPICIGSYPWASASSSAEYGIEALSVVKKVLLEGYIPLKDNIGLRSGHVPRRYLSTENFGKMKISNNDERLKKGEVAITNIHHLKK